MRRTGQAALALALWLASGGAWLWAQSSSQAGGAPSSAPSSAQPQPERILGSIGAIDGSELGITTNQNTRITVIIDAATRLLQLAPGETSLKSATPISLGKLEVGDRVLAMGSRAAGASALRATLVVVMKQQDIAERNREQKLEWQSRGVGGLVEEVDAGAKTITIRVSGSAGSRTLLLRTTLETRYKRYPPDSVKWEEAVASSFEEIRPGDQLRAKGSRSADGGEMAVEEIVAGRFRYLSGPILELDAAAGRLTVKDLRTKQAVTVTIHEDSLMKRLSPAMAEELARRWKAGKGMAAAAPAAQGKGDGSGSAPSSAPARPPEAELNQMLAALPSIAAQDLQKGEAVMIVSTMGSEAAPDSEAASASKGDVDSWEKLPAVLTLLGGVEPLLRASPEAGQSESLITPWSLAAPPGGV